MKMIPVFLGVALCACSAAAQSIPPLALQKTITLPGVSGKFDHFAIDLPGNRLFAAATGNHSVEVIDLASGKVAQTISGLGKPHGLAWIDATHTLYVADGTLAVLRQYRGSPLEIAGELKLSDDADDMVANPAAHLLFVGHGGSGAESPARVAVVDTDAFKLKNDLPVATHPEALDIDLATQRVFANIADSNEIAVIDGVGNAVTTEWKLKGAGHNVPLAYDSENHILYTACRTPAVLLALDGSTGRELARIPTGDGADDLFYDPSTRRLYLIAGSGEVDVFQTGVHGALHSLGKVVTEAGAKTALFVPAQALLYVGIPGAGTSPATIRVYSTSIKGGGQ